MCHHSDCGSICKDTPKPKPHKHAELIKAWADGAIIQFKDWNGEWRDATNKNVPIWSESTEYRIKPEPKPDRVEYCYANKGCVSQFGPVKYRIANVKFTFDGETGNLKSVEII